MANGPLPGNGMVANGTVTGAPSFRASWQSVLQGRGGSAASPEAMESGETGGVGTGAAVSAKVVTQPAPKGQGSFAAQTAVSGLAANSPAAGQNPVAAAAAAQQRAAQLPLASEADAAAQGVSRSTGSMPASRSTGTTAGRPERKQAQDREKVSLAGSVASIFTPVVQPASVAPPAAAPALPVTRLEGQASSASPEAGAVTAGLAAILPAAASSASVRSPQRTASTGILAAGSAPVSGMRQAAPGSGNDVSGSGAEGGTFRLASQAPSAAFAAGESTNAQGSASSEKPSTVHDPNATAGLLFHSVSADAAAPSTAPAAADLASQQNSAGADAATHASSTAMDHLAPHAGHRDAAHSASSAASTLAAAAAPAETTMVNLRSPLAAHPPQASASQQPAATGAAPASAAAHDTFSALDQDASHTAAPTWIHAGSRHAEAGYEDPALGWVSVRADLGTDGIHATLAPGSAAAAQVLSGHLSGLTSHLAEQHATVASLSMASPAGAGGQGGMSHQQMQQGTEDQAQGRTPAAAQAASIAAQTSQAASASQAASRAGSLNAPLFTGDVRGGHISVIV